MSRVDYSQLAHPKPAKRQKRQRVGNDAMLLPKRPEPLRDKPYLIWLTEQPCLSCGRSPCDPAHFRMQWYTMSEKPGDDSATSLCRECHTIQGAGEKKFWVRLLTLYPDLLARVVRGFLENEYRKWKARTGV